MISIEVLKKKKKNMLSVKFLLNFIYIALANESHPKYDCREAEREL